MSKIYDRITPAQERFLLALVAADSVADAARLSKVPDSTARRWLRDRDVRSAWRDLRRQALDMALVSLQAATRQAVETLQRCMGPKMPPGVQVQAARAILDLNTQSIERDSLAARIEELEAALQAYQERAQPTPLEQVARRYA
jgi:hypothetical protein